MIPHDPKATPEGTAIAAGTITAALLDHLVKTGALTVPAVREILHAANAALATRVREPEGYEAVRIIGALLRHFPERHV